MVAIARGNSTIGMANFTPVDVSLPPIDEATPPGEIINYLVEKFRDLEILVEGKADVDQIKTQIAYNDEGIKIQASEIVLVGGVTIAQIITDQSSGSSEIDISITRIVGDKIQTGSITSNNWGAAEGTALDLDNETMTLGGSDTPNLYYDGAGNLSITGTLQAGTILASEITIVGQGDDLGTIADNVTFISGDYMNEDDLDGILAAGVGEVIAGVGLDYQMFIESNHIYMMHKDANPAGLGAGYGGDLRTGLIITANGIAMGHNDASTGNWVDTISINGTTGAGTFSGALSAATGSFTGTVSAGSIIATSITINGVTLDNIEGRATAGNTHAGVSGSNPHNTPLSTISGDLDDIANGSTYFKSTSTQNTGGGRAYTAIDSSYDYQRYIYTSKLAVTGSNPTNGIVMDSAGLRMYDNNLLNIDLPSNGDPATFSGDIITAGQIIASGLGTDFGYTASMVAKPSVSNEAAIIGAATTTGGAIEGYNIGAGNHYGIYGIANGSGSGGAGVAAWSQISGAVGLRAFNTSGGDALYVSLGDAQFDDNVIVDGGINVTGTAYFYDDIDLSGDIDVDGTANLDTVDIDGTTNFAGVLTLQSGATLNTAASIVMSGSTKNLVVGGATNTGNACICIKEGAAGSRIAEQILIYGHNVASSNDTTLGLVLDEGVTSSAGFTLSSKVKIAINGAEYWLGLDAV